MTTKDGGVKRQANAKRIEVAVKPGCIHIWVGNAAAERLTGIKWACLLCGEAKVRRKR